LGWFSADKFPVGIESSENLFAMGVTGTRRTGRRRRDGWSLAVAVARAGLRDWLVLNLPDVLAGRFSVNPKNAGDRLNGDRLNVGRSCFGRWSMLPMMAHSRGKRGFTINA